MDPVALPEVVRYLDRRNDHDSIPSIIEGWLPQGEVTLLSGHGGTGKSAIALQAGVCIALGLPFFGIPVHRRRVAFLSIEDPEHVVRFRLRAICKHLEVDLDELEGWLDLYDASGTDGALFVASSNHSDTTPIYDWLKERLAERQVLVVDGASDAYEGDEIKRAHVRRFLRTLRAVQRNGAVLLLGHVDKGAARDTNTTEGYSGSTAWNNSVRGRWYLRKETDGSLSMSVEKFNYGRPGAKVTIRWDERAGTFVGAPVCERGSDDQARDEAELRRVIFRLIGEFAASDNPVPTAMTGSRTAYKVMSSHSDFPAVLATSAGKKRFSKLMEQLRTQRLIRTGTQRYGKGNSREVFVLPEPIPQVPEFDISATPDSGKDSGLSEPEFAGGMGGTGNSGAVGAGLLKPPLATAHPHSVNPESSPVRSGSSVG